jgi:UDP-N-acetylglucosamine--N-acetylmuramyl-(pentapeptide) pyrophosphoryl-undecaprenol N-acetylglucosamine transferase
MKILITGAHFTPAQAVIEELKKLEDIEIIYVGRKHTIEGDKTPSVESQVLPKLGVKFYSLTAGRLRRYLSLWTIISLLKIPLGFIQAFYILLKEKPDVVVSFGGYVSVPVVVDAWLLNKPVLMHEQTLVTGLANKINGFFADKIAVSFDTDYSFPKQKLDLTGNPIRKELMREGGEFSKRERVPLIYVTGGNQGAHVINEAVGEVLEKLTEKAYVYHQTGDSKFNDFDKLSEARSNLKNPKRYVVKKWFDVSELVKIYNEADLVVSRAGANTLTELAYFGIPTLVIPIPYLHRDEQNKNAKFFENAGLTKILSQTKLNGDSLYDEISDMLTNISDLKKSAQNAGRFVYPDAAKRLMLEIMLLSGS